MFKNILPVFFIIVFAYAYTPGAFVPIDTATIYEKPDEDSYIVKEVTPGTVMYLISRTQRFYYMEANGDLGWIKRSDVKELDPREKVEKTQRVVFVDSIPARNDHSPEAEILQYLPKGAIVFQFDKYLDWRRVTTENYDMVWVENKYLTNYSPQKHEKDRQELIEKYAKYLVEHNDTLKTKSQKYFGHKPVRSK
ncbi:MAG: hypothetical protein ACLFSQ_10950 [Candidatus Zixiibacteriota bacterium]